MSISNQEYFNLKFDGSKNLWNCERMKLKYEMKTIFPKNISLNDMSFGVNFILTNWEVTKVVRMWTRADFEQSLFFSIFFRAKRARNENDHARGRKSLVSRVATQRSLRVCTPLTEFKKMRDAHSRLRRGHLVKLLYPSWYPFVTEYFCLFVLF